MNITIIGTLKTVTSSTLIDVIVEDVNDCQPHFMPKTYEVILVESDDEHIDAAPLIKLRAFDADESSEFNRVEYTFSNTTPINLAEKFRLDPKEGFLYIKEKLTRELQSFELTVQAKDADQIQTEEMVNFVWILKHREE